MPAGVVPLPAPASPGHVPLSSTGGSSSWVSRLSCGLAAISVRRVVAAEQDGVFPDGFYSSTNLETQVRLGGRWWSVENPEMDCGLVVDGQGGDEASGTVAVVRTVPMADVRAGMQVVCGAAGVRVTVPSSQRSDHRLGARGDAGRVRAGGPRHADVIQHDRISCRRSGLHRTRRGGVHGRLVADRRRQPAGADG